LDRVAIYPADPCDRPIRPRETRRCPLLTSLSRKRV
jgi:hypothetical protein